MGFILSGQKETLFTRNKQTFNSLCSTRIFFKGRVFGTTCIKIKLWDDRIRESRENFPYFKTLTGLREWTDMSGLVELWIVKLAQMLKCGFWTWKVTKGLKTRN